MENQQTFDKNAVSLVIPNGVKSIARCTFQNFKNLESITIPKSVTRIGNNEDGNGLLLNAARYYYSESAPTDTENNYWHYVDGAPTPW